MQGTAADLQATASAADPFNLDTRWLAGLLAGLADWASWAGFSWIFIDFDGFSGIWCHNALGPEPYLKVQPAAPIETFPPSWLAGWAGWAGFSWIFIDFDGFSRIWCHGAPKPKVP